MKVISYSDDSGVLHVHPHSLEDLWVLSRVVTAGSQAEAGSWRRFKAERGVEQRAESGEKKPVRLRVLVETVEFAESANRLRITGKITWGEPEEFVQLGEHHTLDIEVGKAFKLHKILGAYDKHLLREAQDRSASANALVVLIDDEKAAVYLLDPRGLKELFELRNSASKRTPETHESLTRKFYSELADSLGHHKAKWLVIAGPGFDRDSFRKFLEEKKPAMLANALVEHASNVERSGATELMKKGLMETLLGKQKLSHEYAALEGLKTALGRGDGMAVYGFDDVRQSLALRAVKLLLVLDEVLRKNPDAGVLTDEAEKSGSDLLIFDSSDDAGQEFASFGIAGLLRFRTKFE